MSEVNAERGRVVCVAVGRSKSSVLGTLVRTEERKEFFFRKRFMCERIKEVAEVQNVEWKSYPDSVG